MDNKRLNTDKLLTLQEVMGLTGVSRSQIYNLMSQYSFPRAVNLSARCSRWSLSEVTAWIDQKKAERFAA